MANIDFLGIGVQKSATSWLFKNLKNHPDIWMPPRKELHYFDRDLKYPSPDFLASDKYEDRLKSTEKHNVIFREKMIKELGNAKASGNTKMEKWFEKYFCNNIDDKWYKSLFADGEGFVKGEITPAYSILETKDILRIKNLFPAVKIILLLRDPVERAWSQFRFYLKRNRFNKSTSIDEIIQFINSPHQIKRGDYIGILSRWEAVFPASQFFVGFYDEVLNTPRELLTRLCHFLNVSPNKADFKYLFTKENVSPHMEIPDEIRKYLVNKYVLEIKKLAKIKPSFYVEKWLDRYEY